MKRYNKVAAMLTFKERDIEDIKTFIVKENEKALTAYHNVLNMAIEQYLGRQFDPIKDAERLRADVFENETTYFLDGVRIGVLKTEFGYNQNDFIRNEISYRITFTPIPQIASYTPQHSS